MRSFFLCFVRTAYVKILHKEVDYEKTELAIASICDISAWGLF